MEQVVDANIILRFLVRDVESQYEIAQKWFKEAEKGKRKFIIKPLVVGEVVFVLESFYKNKREDIAMAMETFLSQRWLNIDEREVLLSLWDEYKNNLHFVDSYLLACAKINKGGIASFDKQLLKYLQTD